MISEIAEPLHCESDPAEGPLPFGERNRLLKLGIQERDETTVCNVSLIQFAMQRLCWPCRGHSSAAFSFDIDVESGQIDSVTSPWQRATSQEGPKCQLFFARTQKIS